ncbi:MAG: endonuclease [Oscillospiraceae bacterium]|nr:endonuclease [Oscillospiraceae bacterium]
MKLTKKLLSMLLVLCMVLSMLPAVALFAGAAIDSSATWTETAWADIDDGATVIIANTNNIALPSTTTSTNPTKVAITVSGSAGALKISPASGSLDSIAWTINGDTTSSSGVQILQYGSTTVNLRLTGTNSNTALRVAATATNNKFVLGSSGKLLKLQSAARYVGEYVSGSDWRTYNSETAANYSGQSLKFYVLNASAPAATLTSISVNAGYQEEYTVGDAFVKPTVTGTYSDGSTANVTSGCTFSGYDMSAEDIYTVTVTHTDSGLTTSYEIMVVAPTAYTLTFSENGTTSTSSQYSGAKVTLPDPTNETVGNYTFLGWSASATVSDKPADLMEAGKSYTMPAANTTLYAVYAKVSESGTGSSITSLVSGTYYLVDTCGGSYYAMSGTGTNVASVDISTAVTENADGTISIDGTNSAVTEAMQYLVTVGTSKTTVQNVSNSSYVGGNSSTSFATSNTNAWTVTASDGRFTFVYGTRCILYRTGYDFRNYATSNRNSSGYGTGYLYLVPAAGGASYSDWTTAPSGTVLPTYTLTYDANTTDTVTGLPEAVSGITEGTVYTLSDATPVRYGYDFYGWAASDTSDDEITSVTVNSDVTVYAIWLEKDKYTVSYYDSDNGTAIATKEYYDGETIAAADVPTDYQKPEGFTFVGWYNATYYNSAAPTFTDPAGTTVTQELTFRAVYAAQGEGNGDGSTFILQLKDDPTIFVGAQSGNNSYAAYTNSAATAAIYGIETSDGNEYLYYLDGTTKIYVYNTGNSTSINFSEILPSGYPWLIEEVEGVTTIQSTAVGTRHFAYNKSAPRFAAYAGSASYPYEYIRVSSGGPDYYTTDPVVPNSYTVTWMSEGTQFTTTTVREGNTITAPATNPAKADSGNKYYTFVGWAASEGGAVLTDFGTATENKTFYAVYTEGTYATVNWVIDGTTETEYYKDGETPSHATPSKESDGTYSYTFSGWDPTPAAVTAGETYTYTATFTQTEIRYVASLVLNPASVRAGKTATAVGKLSFGDTEVTDYAPVYTSSETAVATVDAATGAISALAVGTTDITVTYTVNGNTYTATQTLTVSEGTSGGYTLITQANAPEDFSGEYIIMGRHSGWTSYYNHFWIMTPYWINDSTAIVEDGETNSVLSGITGTGKTVASNNASEVSMTLSGNVATGTIDDVYGYASEIEMESTGDNDFTGTDGVTYQIFDRITSIDNRFAFVIELVDDVNMYYTIRIKGTSYYLANTNTTASGNNGMQFVLNASTEDTTALWYIRWATESGDGLENNAVNGYSPDQVLIESVYGVQNDVSRAILFNPNAKTASGGRFRVYGDNAYNTNGNLATAPNDTQGSITYNLQLFGNPNPFNAQIYYQGDQRTIANPVELPQGMTAAADLESALTPDIADYPNWTLVGDAVWTLSDDSSGVMSLDAATGQLLLNSAEQGDYAIVTVTYTVHDNINNKDYSISTQAKVVVTASLETYTTIIFEDESGKDTEVQYTVNAGLASLPLDYYVVNDMTGENSKTGTVVEGGTPAWSATSTNGYPVSITDGVLDLSQVTGKDIIQITLSGVKGNNVNATQATYKVYVITTPKLVADTATVTDNTTTISIDVLANDQNLPEGAVIYGLGKSTADIAASPVTENVTIGTFGSVSVVDGKVQYTPSAELGDGDQVVFYYAINDNGTIYYAQVTVTADITNESPDVEPGDVIYNLVTKEIVPDPDSYNFTGDYVFMGRKSGKMVDLNQFQILTPNWTGDSVSIEENGSAAANNASFVVLGDITDNVATGTIPTAYDSGATASGSYIRMETTGKYDFTDANGTDRTVLDRITYVNEGFVLTIELVDDVNLYYTIRIKGTNYYLANANLTGSGNNGMEFTNSPSLDDTTMLWKIRWATADDGLQTTDGYTPDQILIESVAALNVTELSADDEGKATLPLSRAILFNNHGWGATNIEEGARFRVYGERAYADKLVSDDYGSGLCYNLFLYGAPVPFTAQIQQDGEVKTVADPVTVSAGRTADVDLESLLLPNIDTEPNYALVGEPVWTISGNSATANGADIQLTDVNEGTFNIGSATEGAYAYVTVTYTVYDKVNDSTHKVTTDARIVITAEAQSFNGVIYTGSDSAPNTVSKNIVTGTPVELDYYVVDNMTSLTSLDATCGFTVNSEIDPDLVWNAVDTQGNTYAVTYDAETGKWTVDTTGAAAGEIITVTMTGAQAKLDGNLEYSAIANEPGFKIYVVDTLQLVADEASLSDLNALTIDVLANDLNLYEGAQIYGLGFTAADIAANAQTANVAIGTYGTVSVDSLNNVIFTPSATVQDGDVITFYYSVLGEDGSDYYAKVTITVDGLLPDGALVTDSLVIDFGLPVTFDPTANDTEDFANVGAAGVMASADGTASTTLDLAEGTATVNADGTVTFTPTKIMTAPAVFYYSVVVEGDSYVGTVQIIPATNVYYEDSLSNDVFTFAPDSAWATIGTTDESAQQRADFVGDISSNVYGYDDAYKGFATYSLGSAHVATVNGTTTLATVDFDFYGTGFDVISLTGGNSGYMIVAITDPANPTEVLYRYVVDTYYGFTYSEAGQQVYREETDVDGNTVQVPVYVYEEVGAGNGEWELRSGYEVPEGATVLESLNGVVYYYEYVGDGNGSYAYVPLIEHWIATPATSQDFYQIPVMKINGLEAGLYHVSIAAYYSDYFNHAGDDSYQFVFDAVRVYDPCGNSEIATDAYKADGENDAHYLNLRDELVNGKESESVDPTESTTESEEPTVSYTASFTVPYGASTPADISGETITMPAAVEAPASYDAYSYSFLGWATAEADNTASAPNYYAAGAEVTLTEDTDFYAVYTYTTGTSTGTSYTLVTDESQMTANAKIVIASADADSGEYYAMGAQGNNNRGAVVVTKNGSTVVIADGVTEFTLVNNGDGTYAFYDGTGYLYAAATGSNHLKTQANVDVNASWTIDVTDATTGAATVVATGSANRNEMMYNSSSNLFSCYASGNTQKNVALYQKGGSATYYTTVLATAEDKPDVYVASLTPSSLTMNIDDIEEVTPSLTNNGTAVTDFEVSYSSDNENAIYAEAGEILALTAGSATVTATFTVGGTVVATATCYVTVNAAAFRATFTGVDEAHLPAAVEGTTITLPDMGASGYTVDGVTYTFLGWVEADVDNVSEKPEYLTAGTSVTLTADKNYIALYSWSEGGSGSSSEFALYSGALAEGDYVIVYNGGAMVAADADSSGRIDYADITISNDTVSNPAANIIWHIAPTGDGYYTIYNSTNGVYAAGNGTKNKAAVITDVTDYAKWTVSGESTYDFTNLGNSDKGVNAILRRNGTYGFACYANSTGGALSLYKAGTGGAASYYYTTIIDQTVTYTAEILAESTSLAVGGTTDIISALTASDGSTPAYSSVSWSSSNTAAVSIVSDGESCTATAEAAGTSKITVTYVIDGIIKKAELTIVVSAANDGTQPSSYSTTYNSGTRGVTCNSLSGTYADEYYTGSYTYSALSQQTGSTLLSSLRSLTTSTHSTTTSYNNCRDNAYRTDCQEEDQTVVLLYTGYAADQDDFNGSAPGWNREHVWPQSLGGFGTSGAGADMHHIRPDDVTTNGDRGNKLFGNVSGGTESLASSLCNNMLGGWYDNSYFEPLDSVKGDVARICLYVYVRYGSTYSECSDITNVFKDTDTLLEWMAMDPVDTWEMGRNVVVENIQGNRNPFIDYPELAWQLFGQEAPDGYATPSGSLLPCTHSYTYSINKGEHTATCSLCGDSKTAAHNYVNKVCECGAQTMTIYFQNNWLWTDVCLYYWYEGGSYADAWPGTAMTWYGKNSDPNNNFDIYTMEVPTHATGVIINGIKNDGSGSRDQTPNIESGWYDGICYYMVWENNSNQVGSYNIGDATINTSAVSAAVLPYNLSNTAPVRSASTASAETESSAPTTRETTVEEGTASGLVFIDGNEAASLEEYEAHGPNNEIYLAKNQAVAFNLSFNTAPKTIQIGLKSVEGDDTSDKASWFVVSCGSNTRTFKITTATEMYYDITDLVTIGVTEEGTYASAYPIIITKTNGDLGSLTYLKWTSVASNTVTKANASTFLKDEDLADILDKVDEIVGNNEPNEEPVAPPTDEDEGPIMPPDEGNDPIEPPVEDETPVADVEKFTDLDKNSWYYEGVAYAVAEGLMNGMSDTEFMPDETVTRAMLVTILYRQAGSPTVGDTDPGFTDVAENAWYYDAVIWAYENGATTGITATEFAPDQAVTRQQMVTFLYRAAGEPAVTSGYGENAPADTDSVAAYAADAMAWAYENQIIKGEDGLLKPEQNATRAQIANIFMRFEKSLALASEM